MEKYENSTSISGKLCGRNLSLPDYESTNKDMTILMHSDINVQDRGFKASYEASLVNDTGLFYFISNYGLFKNCRRWSLVKLGLGFLSYTEIRNRNPSPSAM